MGSQSIDKEKGSKKSFAALDKIKKSKKSSVVENKEVQKEEAHFNIDSILKNTETGEVKHSPAMNVYVEPAEPVEIVKKEEVIVKKVLPKNDEVINHTFDIASKLKPNPVDELENVQSNEIKLTEETVSDVKIETRSSAAIAKDRLKEDVLGSKGSLKPLSENVGYKRTITANDNLTQMLGSPQIQQAEIYANEESTVDENDVVITNDSIFIPWEKAPEEDKKKARKIMKAGVASTLLALTILTFHH
ncbi:hypothetical protein ACTOJ1_001539 [Shigella flexneri]